MKKFNISSFLMICLLAVSGMMFTACDDDLDTNQFQEGGVKLNVWGPCPVARGGELRFIGTGMDQVSAVMFPQEIEVTEITRMSSEEIRVTVPQEAVEGKLVLNTSQGKIETTTEITFLEPVSIDDFSPKSVKAGDELTITGEYLNLMHGVIFADGVVVDEFVSHSRNEIKVIVPAEAQTGRIGVTDLGIQKDGTVEDIPNEIYADVEELGELTVTLPAVAQVLDVQNAKPGDVITVTGTDLDLVTTVLMPNDSIAQFTYADGALAITVRQDAIDGQVRILPASGVEVLAANLTMAVPTELSANPATGLREGDVITITGTNLDVVTNVTFPGMTEATELASQSATELTVAMPAAAQSGDLMLNTAAGKSVVVAITTAKPENVTYAASSVGGGENLIINGQNLDLVASVTFTGGASVGDSTFVAQSATQITLAVPTAGAETGVVTLVMGNGESVEAPEVTITSPNCAYLPSVPESFVQGTSVVLDIINGSHLTNVTINDAQSQFWFDETANTLSIKIPADLSGTCTLKLISDNGEMEYEINIVALETTIWEGSFTLSWNALEDLSWGKYDFSTVKAGQKLIVYFTELADQTYWQIRIAKGNGWAALADWSTSIGGGDILDLEAGATSYSYTLTENDVNELVNEGGLILTGTNITITRVALSNN